MRRKDSFPDRTVLACVVSTLRSGRLQFPFAFNSGILPNTGQFPDPSYFSAHLRKVVRTLATLDCLASTWHHLSKRCQNAMCILDLRIVLFHAEAKSFWKHGVPALPNQSTRKCCLPKTHTWLIRISFFFFFFNHLRCVSKLVIEV
ncbi:hypothetical protein Fmac_032202 [Flemingia macrophylla]|uniref:Secreted protein n=1 Tax=Flemingia macrophylla TaxID=520843 RepID=A0ABD1L490_9FABA